MRNGVYKDKKHNKWIAQAPARLNGGNRIIGRYNTEEEALDARKVWEVRNNFMYSLKDLTLDNYMRYIYYCEHSGDICSKVNTAKFTIGSPVTFKRKDGYKLLRVGSVEMLAHRFIWFIHHGNQPDMTIDHIDGDPSNNKIDNLRNVGHNINLRNSKKRTDNTSGITGIRWREDRLSWVASLSIGNGKTKHKHFKDKGEAIKWRNQMYKEYHYHKNHGRDS